MVMATVPELTGSSVCTGAMVSSSPEASSLTMISYFSSFVEYRTRWAVPVSVRLVLGTSSSPDRALFHSCTTFPLPAPSSSSQLVAARSEEHTSELQSLMRTSYAVFCLKKKNKKNRNRTIQHTHYTFTLPIRT